MKITANETLSKSKSVLKHFKGFTLACVSEEQLYICGYTNKLAGLSCTFQQYSQIAQDQPVVFTLGINQTHLAKLRHLHNRQVQTFPGVTKLLKVQLLLWC